MQSSKVNKIKKVETKLSDGDVRDAIRILCLEGSLAEPDAATILKLREKHPEAPNVSVFPDPAHYSIKPSNVLIFEIKKSISSFKPGSAGGVDSLTSQHLRNLGNWGCNGLRFYN